MFPQSRGWIWIKGKESATSGQLKTLRSLEEKRYIGFLGLLLACRSPCVVVSSRLMRVKNTLIYICGFTRGDCQIALDKTWKCFCICGTLDLLKGTTKQITDDWLLPPHAKIRPSVWFQQTSLPLQARSASILQSFGVNEKVCSELREEEGGKWSLKDILMKQNYLQDFYLALVLTYYLPFVYLSA